MTKYEWIQVLEKAKLLAGGKDETCYRIFNFLLEGVKCLPERRYFDDVTEEEEEEEDEEDDG